jgi:phosphoserine phosphatase
MPDRAVPLAIIYDFDGTLAPGNMQDRQFIPDIGMTSAEFWREVDAVAEENLADGILSYMFVMLEKAKSAGIPVRREDLLARSREIEFFPGVEEWFDRINDYGHSRGVAVEHYVISSGNSEIIEGTAIAGRFSRIYGSKFLYDAQGFAVWPAVAINFTTKTQYLFRINKGAHDWKDGSIINKYVPQSERPVPFENMVYIGDGETDVPCFRLVKDLGGLSVVVFPPRTRNARQRAQRFVDEGRVHCVAPADYTEDSRLDRLVKANIELLANREALGQAMVRN